MFKHSCLTVLFCSVSAFAGDPADGLAFMLDFRTAETAISATSVGNAIKFSGGNAVTASPVGGSEAHDKVHQVSVKCVTPMYPWQTNEVYALKFPQLTRVAEVAGAEQKQIKPVGINFLNAAVKSERMTAYIRFKWGGPLDDVNRAAGWMFLNGYNWSAAASDGTAGTGWGIGVTPKADSVPAKGMFCLMVPNNTQNVHWDNNMLIDPDVWYDLFVDIDINPSDSMKSKISLNLVKPTAESTIGGENVFGKPSFKSISVTSMKKVAYSADGHADLRLGTENYSAAYESQTYNNNAYLKCFRGEMSRVMMWSRILAADEKWRVMSGAWSRTLQLGIENSSADEFSAAASAENEWHASGSWSAAGRALGETNPSLTIIDEIPEAEAGIAKILFVKPVAEPGAVQKISVSVNGDCIGSYDLALPAGRAIAIPAGKWRNGDDRKVRVTISRIAPFAGALELDAVSVCGGWRMDGSMSREGCVHNVHYVGSRDSRTVQRSTSVQSGAVLPCVNISANIPEEALAMFRYSFSAKVSGGSANETPHAFYVNGRKFAEFPSAPANAVLSGAVSPHFLAAGENIFCVSNAAPVGSSVHWTRFSDYEISVRRVFGLALTIR